MPAKRIALIRGINVGRAKRVDMKALREAFAAMGYTDVATLLNSGNVVFGASASAPRESAQRAEARIEEAILGRFGFGARVTVITAAELAGMVAGNPLGEVARDPSRYLVAVLKKAEDRARIEPLSQQDWSPEAFALGARAAYLWCPEGILASRAAEALNRALGDAVTARNWATMTKLHALACG